MIYKDIRRTYKSFLMILCGALLLIIRSASSRLTLAVGLLILIFFSIRLLNAIFVKIFLIPTISKRMCFCILKSGSAANCWSCFAIV